MPDHPHQEIEQRLRAAAETRRRAAGGPFVLHPADRRLLQDEVARTFTPSAREARPPWLAWLFRHRAGLVFYSALALVVMVCVPGMLAPAGQKLRKPSSPTTASQSGEQPRPQATDKAAPPAVAEPSRPKVAAPPAPGVRAEKSVAEHPVSAPAPASAAAPAAVLPPAKLEARSDPHDIVLHDSANRETAREQAQSRQYAPPASGAAPSEAPAASGFRAAKAIADVEPFSYFRLERSGPAVTVVDADGSVYRGALLSEPERDRLAPPPTRGLAAPVAAPALGGAGGGAGRARTDNQRRSSVPAPTPMPTTAQAAGLSFLVTGTNLTSQQTVRFQGSVPWPLDRQNATQTWSRSQIATQLSTATQRLPAAPAGAGGTNAALVGELQIGPAAPVRLEARPANR
jgi:hypothetical protein